MYRNSIVCRYDRIHIGMEGEKSGSDSEKYYRATQEIMQRQSRKKTPYNKIWFV